MKSDHQALLSGYRYEIYQYEIGDAKFVLEIFIRQRDFDFFSTLR